jgi:hypothetical protein
VLAAYQMTPSDGGLGDGELAVHLGIVSKFGMRGNA